MDSGRDSPTAGWRPGATAFALSLAAHGVLLAAALWLVGVPDGAPRGEHRIEVALSPAPAAAPRPAADAAPIEAPVRPVAAAASPGPRAAPGRTAPLDVLAAQREAEEEAERQRLAALAARALPPIAPPSHSHAPSAARTETVPVGGTSGGAPAAATAEAQRGFVELHVLDWLAQHRSYPRAARRAGIEGTVHVRFVVDPQGRIAESSIERSSGARVLDRAALALLERASPVPGIAQFGLLERMELRLPVDYRLRRAARTS
jgi:protein TonB